MELRREIGELEAQLDPKSSASGELAKIRRGLEAAHEPAIALPNLRIGFACKQRWDDMVGDDRVRACGGCDRPVFNLSAMTRDEAARLLATRGLTPCVRFYRRPDGTVMTTDCPTGARPERRRLAVVASSLAAGTALAGAPSAWADPPQDSTSDAPATEPPPMEVPGETIVVVGGAPTLVTTTTEMGVPVTTDYEMGEIFINPRETKRPTVEWSLWGRLGVGVASQQHPTVLARRLTPPDAESSSMWEAAAAAELTVGVARDGNLRLGAWGEVRTSSGPVAGGELVLEDLPPHPWDSRINGAGSVVLRLGGNSHVITGALGFGYVGSWPRSGDHWANHVVGARIVASVNRSLDDPNDWSATIGLEVEPIGALHAVFDLAKGD